MADLIFVVLILAFFAVMVLLVAGAGRLISPSAAAQADERDDADLADWPEEPETAAGEWRS